MGSLASWGVVLLSLRALGGWPEKLVFPPRVIFFHFFEKSGAETGKNPKFSMENWAVKVVIVGAL